MNADFILPTELETQHDEKKRRLLIKIASTNATRWFMPIHPLIAIDGWV
jgi:hypothetical protein